MRTVPSWWDECPVRWGEPRGFSVYAHSREGHVRAQTGRGPTPRTWPCWYPGPWTSRTVTNKFLLFKQPSQWCCYNSPHWLRFRGSIRFRLDVLGRRTSWWWCVFLLGHMRRQMTSDCLSFDAKTDLEEVSIPGQMQSTPPWFSHWMQKKTKNKKPTNPGQKTCSTCSCYFQILKRKTGAGQLGKKIKFWTITEQVVSFPSQVPRNLGCVREIAEKEALGKATPWSYCWTPRLASKLHEHSASPNEPTTDENQTRVPLPSPRRTAGRRARGTHPTALQKSRENRCEHSPCRAVRNLCSDLTGSCASWKKYLSTLCRI